jgi:hypothetical protein
MKKRQNQISKFNQITKFSKSLKNSMSAVSAATVEAPAIKSAAMASGFASMRMRTAIVPLMMSRKIAITAAERAEKDGTIVGATLPPFWAGPPHRKKDGKPNEQGNAPDETDHQNCVIHETSFAEKYSPHLTPVQEGISFSALSACRPEL